MLDIADLGTIDYERDVDKALLSQLSLPRLRHLTAFLVHTSEMGRFRIISAWLGVLIALGTTSMAGLRLTLQRTSFNILPFNTHRSNNFDLSHEQLVLITPLLSTIYHLHLDLRLILAAGELLHLLRPRTRTLCVESSRSPQNSRLTGECRGC